ncbi:UNVERIFIED_CONTAM: hypothetical protein FKN15_073884 [Acipenser sinensis]
MELDVFVGNTTIMDEDVYLLWLDGYTVSDAVSMRMKSGILEQCGASQDVLESDTMDHYRTFQMTERLLHNPSKLVNQLLFQIPPHRQNMLIERYYAFDEAFVREVLGKKLSKGTKKDLDDVSAKTGITLKSCRRQNLSRGLVNIAGKLMNNKDVRDLFIDLVEKVGGEGGFDDEQGGAGKTGTEFTHGLFHYRIIRMELCTEIRSQEFEQGYKLTLALLLLLLLLHPVLGFRAPLNEV